jgi:hypothetical protein
MKIIPVLFLSLICANILSQEIKELPIKSDVNEVTVYLDGAQIMRQKTIDLPEGKTIVKFVNLSPFIDAKSLQVKTGGNLTVLSVKHQQNYLEKSKKSVELSELVSKLDAIDDKIRIENTYISIINEELAFLQNNRDIGGKNEQVSVPNLKLASEFYSSKLTSLKMKEIERNKTLKDLNKQRSDIQNQINTLSGKKEFPTGEVLVEVDANLSKAYPFELSYIVGNAGWFPTYDIRASNIDEPVQLMYKANVKQNTKVDWQNVKLIFSSAEPNISGVAPELQTYYLNYHSLPPSYKNNVNNVRGRVTGSNGESLPGVNVIVNGSTIGTITDMGGNYSITVPSSGSLLTYSYIGYHSQSIAISGEIMNIKLQEDIMILEDVAVVGYGSSRKLSSPPRERADGLSIRGTESEMSSISNLPTLADQFENQTSVDFEINTPYSINSDNKNTIVDLEIYELPAFYQYYCVPKINKDAYLMAHIVDWEKYNLLEGEANIFFEDTYVGKTLVDIRYATDTLALSLGRDRQVSVIREKIKDFTTKRFIGNKKEETRGWKTTVKNNKSQVIQMVLLDQVPVSTLDEIEVNVQNISGAKHDLETGEIKWEFTLEPNEKMEFELKYSVKYPRNRTLVIE